MQPPAVSRQQHKQQQHQTGSSETLKRGTALIASRHSSPWGLTKKNLAGGAAELGAPDGLEHQKERSLSEGEPESMDSYVRARTDNKNRIKTALLRTLSMLMI